MLERDAESSPRFAKDGDTWWYHPPNGHKARAVTGICEWCAGRFVRTRSSGRSYRFCANECYRAWRKDQRTVPCERCGGVFERGEVAQKYCSHECYTANNTGENHVHFNGYTTVDHRYVYYSRSHPVHAGKTVHNVLWWEVNPNGRCEKCGGAVDHVHHRDEDTFNNDLSNLAGLCASCHVRHHLSHDPAARVA